MNINLNIEDIISPCTECENFNECFPKYNYCFDNSEPIKNRLFNILFYGDDCFYPKEDE